MTLQENIAPALAGSRILVAEDDPFIAAELHNLLTHEGVVVMGPVPTVKAAMAAIQSGKPDAAVLDVNLRDTSSAPVAAMLRASAVPVVLVTGYARHMLDDPELLAAHVLAKPVSSDELLAALDDALAPLGRNPARPS